MVAEVELVKKNFTLLFNTFLEEGRIPEEVFDDIGIDEDINSDGKICPRRSLADCHGWAMCLSANTLRLGRVVKASTSKREKENKIS